MINPPSLFRHQRDALERLRDKIAYALFMEQGTGKSAIVVHETIDLIERGLITAAIIIAPNQVHVNWAEQFAIHAPVASRNKYVVQVYKSQPTPKAREKQKEVTREIISSGKVLVFLMNIEALSHPTGQDYLTRLLLARKRNYVVIDESHKIKTPGATRTRFITRTAKLTRYRRILTGTPHEEGIENLYSQFAFLDRSIIGHNTFTSFKQNYCIMGGYDMREIVGYRDRHILAAKIAPHIFAIRKDECLDLPDKFYIRHEIEMTPAQDKLYRQLETELLVDLEQGTIDGTLAITKMLRLQQILCGHDMGNGQYVHERAEYVAQLIDEEYGKSVVFCRFVKDVELVCEALAAEKIGCIGIHGEVKDRMNAISSWRTDPKIKALVITVQTGGTGLTLVEASNLIYYSNSFSSTDRLQSEDRLHRIGQTRKVTIHDVVVPGTIDDKVQDALMKKQDAAAAFRDLVKTGRLREVLKSNEPLVLT